VALMLVLLFLVGSLRVNTRSVPSARISPTSHCIRLRLQYHHQINTLVPCLYVTGVTVISHSGVESFQLAQYPRQQRVPIDHDCVHLLTSPQPNTTISCPCPCLITCPGTFVVDFVHRQLSFKDSSYRGGSQFTCRDHGTGPWRGEHHDRDRG